MNKAVRAFVVVTKVCVGVAVALGGAGCSRNNLDENGMRTTGVGIPVPGGPGIYNRQFDATAGRSIVIGAGLGNPDPRVRAVTEREVCKSPASQADRVKAAALVDKVTGGRPSVPCVNPK